MNATSQSADSCTFPADGYTQLDLFVQRAEQGHAPTIRLHAGGTCVAERVMDADLYRQRFQIDLDPQERYTLEIVDATVPYMYLAGGDDLLDRGIRVLDAASGEATAGDGAPESADPVRAAVHFEPPEHWMNDPNGLCRFQGRYHLYYQFNPYGWGWDNMHWGHAASRDLVHWTYLPVILEPQRELHTRRGISGGAFSGSAITIDAEGRPCPGDDAAAIRFYLTRHFEVPGQPDTVEECQTTCVSTDSLTAGPETVVVRREGADFGRDFRDSKIETGFGGALMILATNLPSDQVPASGETGVSDANEGGWFTLSPHGEPDVDQPDPNRIPAIVTFRNDTPDLADDAWTYVGPMVADRGYAEGRTYECPDAFPLDGADVAIGAIMHIRTKDGCFQPIRWYTGRLDEQGRLDVGHSGWCDFGDCFYAVQSFRDDDGRRIAIGWLADHSGVRREAPGRANGAMSLPRELHVRDGRLFSRPVDEVYDLLIGGELPMDEEDGAWQVSDNTYYADIHPHGECTAVLMDTGEVRWTLECRDGEIRCSSQGAPSDDLACVTHVDEVKRIEVFYDHGIIEVFVNDGEAAGAMLAYDERENGGFSITGNADCEVRTLRR